MKYKNSDDNRYRVQFMRSTEELMDQLTVKEFISYLEENAEFEDYTVEYIDKKCVKCRAYDLTEENSKLHKEFLVTEDALYVNDGHVQHRRFLPAERLSTNGKSVYLKKNRDKIREKGWVLVDGYVDEGKSGTVIKRRDEYQRLLEDMELNKFDVVVVKDQERLQRNTRDWYNFIDRLVQNKLKLYFYLDNTFYSPDNALITGIKSEEEWVIVKNDHEAIVSEELWDAVNDEIQSHRNKGNSGTRGKRGGTDLLSGKLVCSCCGRVLWKHASQGSYKSKEGRKYTYKRYTQWYCSGKMGRGELACTDPATISGVKLQKYLVEMADMFLDYSTVEYSKNLLKRRTISWLEDLKDKLTTPNDNGKIEQDLKALEGKRGKLIDLYTDELISKEEFKSRSVDLDAEIEKKRTLLVPVEENPDIKAIEDTIANIDAEIEALFEDEAMVEEKKVQFIREHIKKIYVSKNSDVFIVLDNVAGAFLFIDKEDTRIEVVPVAEYNPKELSEEGITENDFVPFDRESMPLHHGRIRHEIFSQTIRHGIRFLHRFCRYKQRRTWKPCPSRHAEETPRGRHPMWQSPCTQDA